MPFAEGVLLSQGIGDALENKAVPIQPLRNAIGVLVFFALSSG